MEDRFETFTVLIARISRSIRRLKAEEMERLGLKGPHVSCLYYLGLDGPLTAAERGGEAPLPALGRPALLVSACLLGCACRYDGKSKGSDAVRALAKDYQLIPVCPEQLGGLSTPRQPSERRGDRVVMKDGRDVTAEYRRGAEETLRLARLFGCAAAVLKEKSPSCGSGLIHDGSFSGDLVPGDGVTAEVLKARGIRVLGESQAGEL